MFTRTRRLRSSKALRDMVRNVTINLSDFIYPLFIEEGENKRKKYHLCLDNIDGQLTGR